MESLRGGSSLITAAMMIMMIILEQELGADWPKYIFFALWVNNTITGRQ